MNGAELCTALHSSRRVYGTCITSPSPYWPPSVCQGGLDFVFIDTEHVPLARDTLSWMCRAYGGLKVAPVVRIPSPDPYAAAMVLDGGAEGLIAPYIETPEQVRVLSGVVTHRPLKGARLRRLLGGEPCEPELARYLSEHSGGFPLIAMIESVPAIEALDGILQVPGLDAVLIGPHDLSCSLGLPEQYGHPRFLQAVRTVLRKARGAGLGAGIHFGGDLEIEAGFLRDGMNLVVHGTDNEMFMRALAEDLTFLRQTVEPKAAAAVPAATVKV